MYRDAATLVCIVGKTELRYQWRCVDDLHAMLRRLGLAEVEHNPRNNRMRAI